MKNINQSAPVISKRSMIINANAGHVWNLLSNINNWPAWQKDISKASLEGSLQPGTIFRWKTGGAAITSTIHTVVANRELGWTGKTMGLFAIHNFRLVEKEDQTEVIVEESMEGLLAKIFKKSFQKNMDRGMENWLHLLKETCEQK